MFHILDAIEQNMHTSNVVQELAKIKYLSTFLALKNRLFKAIPFSQHKLEEAWQTAKEMCASTKFDLHAPTHSRAVCVAITVNSLLGTTSMCWHTRNY